MIAPEIYEAEIGPAGKWNREQRNFGPWGNVYSE